MSFARDHNMLFIEASARTREGVQCAFEELVQKVRRQPSTSKQAFLTLQIVQTPGLWENTQSGYKLTSANEENAGYSSCGC